MQHYNRYAIMKLTELMEVKNWNSHILKTFQNLPFFKKQGKNQIKQEISLIFGEDKIKKKEKLYCYLKKLAVFQIIISSVKFIHQNLKSQEIGQTNYLNSSGHIDTKKLIFQRMGI